MVATTINSENHPKLQLWKKLKTIKSANNKTAIRRKRVL
jgi:hypothetical protein